MTNRTRVLLHGSCHCGNLKFTLDWQSDPVVIVARACGCSFCRKHGGVWTADPAGKLQVLVRDASALRNYRFGTRTADFHLCTGCGIVPVVTSRIDDRLYAVVNVNALDDLDPALLSHAVANFDGEGLDSRLARRQRHWIGHVEWSS
ncbi:MAG TPA: hypothetical protein VMI92_14390 [Steroidobacteraceae bacterium]|nr:hypothetical protein [Steroidobacteraceae bacterium]